MADQQIIDALLDVGFSSHEESMVFFDRLAPVQPDVLVGMWKGVEIPSHHFLSGMLKPIGWYGKIIYSVEEAHPLLFYSVDDTSVFSVNPAFMQFTFKYPPWRIWKRFVNFLKPLLGTSTASATIELKKYRGKKSAALVYSTKNIVDHYRQLDENTLCGLMTGKGLKEPFIYLMVRESKDTELSVEI